MKALAISVIISFIAGMVACDRSIEVQSMRWQAKKIENGFTAPPEKLKKFFSSESLILRRSEWKGQSIVRGTQKVGNVAVENTGFQLVKAKSGEWKSFSLTYVEDFPHQLVKRAQILEQQKNEKQKMIIKLNPELQELPDPLEVSVVLSPKLLGWTAYYKWVTFNRDESDVLQFLISESGKIESRKSLARHFKDGKATVFRTSPDVGELQEQILKSLTGDGTLTSPSLRVQSDLSPRAYSKDLVFRYDPSEVEFSETQAFFHCQRVLEWFKAQLGFELPFRLDVKVHIGGSRPTNAAFYYDQNIRLGEGDGQTYKGISRDPSIVGHEVGHAIVDALAGLPFEGEGGSINEGLADFFIANILDKPEMADYAYLRGDYRRTLENRYQAYIDFNGGLYNDSLPVSGTFWDIKKILGQQQAAQLAISFLIHLGPTGAFKDFSEVMNLAVKELGFSPEQNRKITEILRDRGWHLAQK